MAIILLACQVLIPLCKVEDRDYTMLENRFSIGYYYFKIYGKNLDLFFPLY